jgi:hypothetical protein
VEEPCHENPKHEALLCRGRRSAGRRLAQRDARAGRRYAGRLITMKTTIALMTTDDGSKSDLNVDHGEWRRHVARQGADASGRPRSSRSPPIDGAKSVKNLLQIVPNARREVVERADNEIKNAVDASFWRTVASRTAVSKSRP